MKKIFILLPFLLFSLTMGQFAHAATAQGSVAPGGACTQDTDCADPNGNQYGCYPEGNGICTVDGDPPADGTVQPGGACTNDSSCQDVGGQNYGCINGLCTLDTPTTTGNQTTTSGASTGSSNFVPLTNFPGIQSLASSGDNASDLAAFLNNVYKICIGLAATLAVLQIMRAGIVYMGGDSITETSHARTMILQSILGLILVLSPAIVFGIINPNILSLQIGGSAGLASLAPPPISNTTTTTAAPATTDPMCSGVTSPTWTQVANNSTCAAALNNPAWIQVNNDCCVGSQPSTTQDCCAQNTSYVAPVTPALVSANQFSIAYQSTDYNTGKACVAYSDQGNFATQAACITAYNNVISAEKGTYAIAESCTDAGNHSLTGPGAATLSALPACPSH